MKRRSKSLVAQHTRWLGLKQENEENHAPGIQENSRLFGVMLSGYAEGGRATAHPHSDGMRALAADRGWEVEVVPLVAHEKLFGSYWRHTFGPPSSLLQLLGKGISVRASRPPQGG